MARDLSKLNIFQVICCAAKDGFRDGRSRVHEKAEHDRQLRAEEIRALRADRAKRAKGSDPDKWH